MPVSAKLFRSDTVAGAFVYHVYSGGRIRLPRIQWRAHSFTSYTVAGAFVYLVYSGGRIRLPRIQWRRIRLLRLE